MVATPVGSREAAQSFAALADEFVRLATLSDFRAVGLYYRDFHQVTDDEVIALLRRAQQALARTTSPPTGASFT